jgi:hypothetical protein
MIGLSGLYVRGQRRRMKKSRSMGYRILTIVLIALALISYVYPIEPSSPVSFENKSTESPDPTLGAMLNTTGGTISTVNFNATTQNPRWKGFVGNVTGKYALMDSDNMSIYDWTLTTVKGEIYSTRNSTLVDWSNVDCASEAEIIAEQTNLGFVEGDEDSINRTFNYTSHTDFYAGDNYVSVNSCSSTYLYIGGEAQESKFNELLLFDDNLVYAALLEDSETGFNNQLYDFQMIVADNTNQGAQSEIYYFYIELV